MPLGRSTATTGAALGIHSFNQRPRRLFHRPVKPGAEKRVNDDIRAAKPAHGSQVNRARPLFCSGSCVPFEACDVPSKHQPNPEAPLREQPGRYKTIAAIVSRPSQDDDLIANCVARRDRGGDRPARPFHKLDSGDPAGYRQTIGLRHLGGGE